MAKPIKDIGPNAGNAIPNPSNETDYVDNKVESISIPNLPIPDDLNVSLDGEVEGGYRDHFFRPAIICGTCEHCGTARYVGGSVKKTINKDSGEIAHHLAGGKWEAIDATKCPHYKGLFDKGKRIQCSYCGEAFTGAKNSLGKFSEVLASRIIYVMSFADKPNTLIMYCDGFECREKHLKRMKNA